MADTPQEIVERELREFKRYTGDGLPGEPVNAPLPVGDPQSGVWNPKKKNLRVALMAPIAAAAQSASEAAQSLAEVNEKYLGAFADDASATAAAGGSPTTGAEYWNTTAGKRKTWDGSAWQANSIALNDGDVTIPKLAADVAVRLVEFDIRDSQFAGGAPMNGIDSDSPALQAAIDYCKTLGTRYEGGTAAIRMPRGHVRIATTIDLYAGNVKADNITIFGEGDGATTVDIVGNFPGFVSSAAPADTLYRTQFRDFMVYGPGADQTNAYAFDIDALNNGRFERIRVQRCRRGLSLANQWQTSIVDIRIDGSGELANYDGLYLKDGAVGTVENSVLVVGGQISNCQRWGFRGESISGSKVFGLEVLGCDSTGVYLGESPSGKDLKWFSWVGGLIDTCPDLLVVKKGSSAVAELMHFSGLWMGYANDDPGEGVGAEFVGISDFTFSADILTNTVHALVLDGCTRANIQIDEISTYDRKNQGGAAIVANDTSDSRLLLGSMKKNTGSPSITSVTETGTSTGNLYVGANADGIISVNSGSRAVACRMNGQPRPDEQAVIDYANLSSYPASSYTGASFLCSNTGRGLRPVYSDGTDWRFMSDDAVVA